MIEQIIKNLKIKFNSDKVIDDYQKGTLKGLYVFEKFFIESFFEKLTGMKILNPGCGTGREALALAKKGASLCCIDISEKMIATARENFEKDCLVADFYVSDCLDLSMLKEEYDLIFATNNFLEHFPRRKNRIQMLQNFWQKLKPDGILITCVHDRLYTEKYKEYWRQQQKEIEKGIVVNGYEMEFGDKFFRQITSNDDTSCDMFMHIYSLEEILEDLVTSGFELLDYKYIPEIYKENSQEIENGISKDVVYLANKRRE